MEQFPRLQPAGLGQLQKCRELEIQFPAGLQGLVVLVFQPGPLGECFLNEPTRLPEVADRNILANQAYNAFSAFPEDALVRIAPADIRKKGKVPKNGSLFFTIFQTFMSGPPKEDGTPSPWFGDYHNAIADALADLGQPEEIGRVFAGFQKDLYDEHVA